MGIRVPNRATGLRALIRRFEQRVVATIPGLGLAIGTLVVSSPALAGDRLTGHAFATRSEVLADHGMAATAQPLATQAALQILFHTIIPAFVTRKGVPVLSFGVMGCAAQPQMHVQVLINIIDFGMNLQEAGDAPRMLHLGSSQPTGETMTDGGTVYLESGIDAAVLRGLSERGHRLGSRVGGFGGYQAVGWREVADGTRKRVRVWVGASESRKDGMAAGY